MRVFLFTIILSFFSILIGLSQISSRNGYHHSPAGTLRALLVFAEVVNDPHELGENAGWKPGEMPPNAANYFDPVLPDNGNLNGYLTKYFNEVSFGSFIFLGDYYPELVRIDFDTLRGRGEGQVIEFLDSRYGSDILTASGLSVNSNDFDQWTLSTQRGGVNKEMPDGKIDMLFIIWRVNSRINIKSGGYIQTSQWNIPLKEKSGFNDYSSMVSDWHIMSLVRHEFAHSLLGGNNFHAGGAGAGAGMFLSDVGGYGLISTWNRNMDFVNAWDRYHLGWKNPDSHFFISARDANYNMVNADLVYGNELPARDGVFILRDFAAYGDAVRIKLPHLLSENPSAREQWLWIENHQFPENMVHYKSCLSRGIYINLQIGNNELSPTMRSRTNYIYPLSALGNYDWEYHFPGSETDVWSSPAINDGSQRPEQGKDPSAFYISTNNNRSNPLTGYHTQMLHAWDHLEKEKELIYNKEVIFPLGVMINNEILPDSGFCYKTYPVFGSRYEAFLPGKKLGIAENPAPVPVLTYHSRDRMGNQPPNLTTATDDNRHIFLNGLTIEIMEQMSNGDIMVKVRWNDYAVDKDVRWCGPLVLREKIELLRGKTILLDQGLTPTRPVEPLEFMNEKIFASPTELNCKKGASISLDRKSAMDIRNGSSLVLESGSSMEISRGATVNVYPGSSLLIKQGANLAIYGNGSVDVRDGGNIIIEEGANINLVNRRSRIIINGRPAPL